MRLPGKEPGKRYDDEAGDEGTYPVTRDLTVEARHHVGLRQQYKLM